MTAPDKIFAKISKIHPCGTPGLLVDHTDFDGATEYVPRALLAEARAEALRDVLAQARTVRHIRADETFEAVPVRAIESEAFIDTPAPAMRCAECDCDNPPHDCNWIKPGPSAPAQPGSLQYRVAPWMDACFGPEISSDKLERGDRFIEEALELLQSGDYPKERIAALVDYTYARDKGDPKQEVGGVMITLAAYCLAHGLDMHDAGETELARIWTKVDKIREKQAAKPTGSALPVAAPAQPSVQEAADEGHIYFIERLLVSLWGEIEDKTDVSTQDEISDCVGWSKLTGTIAGLREKHDALRPRRGGKDMTDMREKIAEIISQQMCRSDRPVGFDETADAIIAALPGMVTPLAWEDLKGGSYAWPLGLHYYTEGGGDDWSAACMIGNDDIWSDGFLSLESAKAAATTHYTAQIVAAFGIAQGGE
jgi:NTP pyrophosphatase (non-canonical NTP hydrolase)